MLLLTLVIYLYYFYGKSLYSVTWKNNKWLAPFIALFLCCYSDSSRVNFCCVTIVFCFFFHIRNRVYSSVFPLFSIAWKVSKYWVFSVLYFTVLELNTEIYWKMKTPYLKNFHSVFIPHKALSWSISEVSKSIPSLRTLGKIV